MEETPKSSSAKQKLRVVQSSIDVYAAQCGKCFKWRVIPTLEEYENIRSRLEEEPFFCEQKSSITCENPEDIAYDASRIWVIDKPNIPKTPTGFKRLLVLRKDFSKLDAYYITPTKKKLRTRNEVAAFLEAHPEYESVDLSDFNFAVPKIMEHTIPRDLWEKDTPQSDDARKMKTVESDA